MKKSKFEVNEMVFLMKKCLKRIYYDSSEKYIYKPFYINKYYKIYTPSGKEEYRYILQEFDNIIFKKEDLIKFDLIKLKKLIEDK